MSSIIIIFLSIVIVSVTIYICKNFQDIIKKLKEKSKNKMSKILYVILFILFLCFFSKRLYNTIIEIKANLELYRLSKINEVSNAQHDKDIISEIKYYNTAINVNYQNQNYEVPYIPDGFEYVEGEWNTGFVIQDENKNQYVWVPCTNKDSIDIPKLEKVDFSANPFISKNICVNQNYEEFIKSALENGGFYISRYEIGKEADKPVSKMGVEVWCNITRKQANDIIHKMYENKNFNCELMNGYAYDTTITWLMKSNEIKPNIIDVQNQEKIYTGRKKYNNIYDLVDTMMELTSETDYENVIIRGVANDRDTAKVIEGINDIIEEISDYERFSIKKEENFFSLSNLLTFRTIIYK